MNRQPEVREQARDRWPSILAALGVPETVLNGKNQTNSCTHIRYNESATPPGFWGVAGRCHLPHQSRLEADDMTETNPTRVAPVASADRHAAMPAALTKHDLVGRRVGNLTVLGDPRRHPRNNGGSVTRMVCLCDCGALCYPAVSGLVSGKSGSCGCRKSGGAFGKTPRGNVKHGLGGRNRPKEYGVWRAMKDRCARPKNREYANYGGRGVRVCEEWIDNFPRFYEDMGPRPSDAHSIDRIDNNGHYEPSNCRWSSASEQAKNKRKNLAYEHRGELRNLKDIVALEGVPYGRTYQRMFVYGWSLERALGEPAYVGGRRKARG